MKGPGDTENVAACLKKIILDNNLQRDYSSVVTTDVGRFIFIVQHQNCIIV